MNDDINRYRDFLTNLPAKLQEIIGGDPERLRLFKKEVRRALDNSKVVQWVFGYFKISDTPSDKCSLPKLSTDEQRQASYLMLAYRHDAITDCPPAQRLCDWQHAKEKHRYRDEKTGKMVERPIYHEDIEEYISSEISDLGERQRIFGDKTYPVRYHARLSKALQEVKADLAIRVETQQKAKSTFFPIAISVILIILFEFLVYLLPITWITKHPHTYGIQGSIICLIPSLVVGLFKPQWRNWCWGTAAIAFLVLLLSLLGGESSR